MFRATHTICAALLMLAGQTLGAQLHVAQKANRATATMSGESGPTAGACCRPGGECVVVTAQGCFNVVGAYQGDGTTCAKIDCRARCEPICDFCWEGTPFDGACDADWAGDGPCDCACEFDDPDCAPTGACCVPANGYCTLYTETTCRLYAAGVFQGAGVACEQVDCRRCDPGCDWCWVDTIGEHACLPEWAGDGECDCGCQFPDADCACGVCGNLICEENGTSCAEDCKDLRAFAEFQNCFQPGGSTPPECGHHVYADPPGIGLEDFTGFDDLWSGP